MKTRTNLRTALSIAFLSAGLGLVPTSSALADDAVVLAQPKIEIRPVVESDQPTRLGTSPDFNHSGVVDVYDLLDYLGAWLAGKSSADTNGNGKLEIEDLFEFINIWFNSFGTKVDNTRQ